MGNIMAYNSDQMAETSGLIGQSSAKIGEAQTLASSGFQGMSSLFGSGIGIISDQLGSLGGSLSNIQGIMTRQTDAMFSMDEALARAADSIDVTQDFVKNEQNRYTAYHNELLEKVDGKSVNDGNETDVKENMAESSIGQEQLMGSIVTSTEATEEKYDATSGIAAQQGMRNITTGGGLGESKYNANSGISGQERMDVAQSGSALTEQNAQDMMRSQTEQALMDMTGAGGISEQHLGEIRGSLQALESINPNATETKQVDLEFNMMNNEVEKTADILPPTANSTLGSVVEMTTDAAKEAVSEGK